MTNYKVLTLERGFNLEDVRNKIKYFLGDMLLQSMNPIQKEEYVLLTIPTGCEQQIQDVIVQDLPCNQIHYIPKCIQSILKQK